MSQLYIPKKIKIGFNKRDDTFTGKLAFITYYDDKNVLRQEKSWEGWRDSKIKPLEFDNEPRSNFVFNKGVERYSSWGNSGRSMVRVHDSRDFEFEISVDNLMGILMHSDVSKRDIVQECVYAWSGKSLVLLPTNSEEYKEAISFTKKQSLSISSKDLKVGMKYSQKKSDTMLTYIGYYPWYKWEANYYRKDGQYIKEHSKKGKKHIFFDGEDFVTPNVNVISEMDDEDENFAKLVVKFNKSFYAKPFTKIKLVDKKYRTEGYNENDYYKLDAFNNLICLRATQSEMYFDIYKIEYNESVKFTHIDSARVREHYGSSKKALIDSNLDSILKGVKEYFKDKDFTPELSKEFLKDFEFKGLELVNKDDVSMKFNVNFY